MNLQAIWKLFQETFKEWSEDKASRLAAALAYYTIFSIAPLLIIVIAIAGAVFGEEAARGQIVGQIQGLVAQKAQSFSNQPFRMLTNQRQERSLLSLVS